MKNYLGTKRILIYILRRIDFDGLKKNTKVSYEIDEWSA